MKKYIGTFIFFFLGMLGGVLLSSYFDNDNLFVLPVAGSLCLAYFFFWRKYFKNAPNIFDINLDNIGEGPVKNYGTCPKCWRKISMLASKCPYCTADLC